MARELDALRRAQGEWLREGGAEVCRTGNDRCKDGRTTPELSPVPRNIYRWKLVGAFGSLYLIWGSTYLAIRFALETIPPFTMTGARFVVAGMLLYSWARLRGSPPPTLEQWPPAILIGALLLLLG